jgi:hypothetical protein
MAAPLSTPLFVGRTSTVIAHRFSPILAADRILVFDLSGRRSRRVVVPSQSRSRAEMNRASEPPPGGGINLSGRRLSS